MARRSVPDAVVDAGMRRRTSRSPSVGEKGALLRETPLSLCPEAPGRCAQRRRYSGERERLRSAKRGTSDKLAWRSGCSGARRRPRSNGWLNGRVGGTARLDRRTKDLVRRLHPGNIAIIDHDDLDLLAAEGLIEHGVAGVINAGTLDHRPLSEHRPPDARPGRHPARSTTSGREVFDADRRGRPHRDRRGQDRPQRRGDRRRDAAVRGGDPAPDERRARRPVARRSKRSRRTRSSTSGANRTSCSTRCGCPSCARSSAAGTRSSSFGATTTSRTSERCGASSAR